jgi:hypothetical protein
LQRHWAWIFEEKPDSWYRHRQAWPRERTHDNFRKWFDVRLVDLVLDLVLVDAPIVHEEF